MVTAYNDKYFSADPGNRTPNNAWARDADGYAPLVVRAAPRAFDRGALLWATPGSKLTNTASLPDRARTEGARSGARSCANVFCIHDINDRCCRWERGFVLPIPLKSIFQEPVQVRP